MWSMWSRFQSGSKMPLAKRMGLIGYFASYRAIFLVAAALVLPLRAHQARARHTSLSSL
jgi:hypothetical protein